MWQYMCIKCLTFALIIFILFISFQTVALKASQCVAAVRPNWVTPMAVLGALIDIFCGRQINCFKHSGEYIVMKTTP